LIVPASCVSQTLQAKEDAERELQQALLPQRFSSPIVCTGRQTTISKITAPSELWSIDLFRRLASWQLRLPTCSKWWTYRDGSHFELIHPSQCSLDVFLNGTGSDAIHSSWLDCDCCSDYDQLLQIGGSTTFRLYRPRFMTVEAKDFQPLSLSTLGGETVQLVVLASQPCPADTKFEQVDLGIKTGVDTGLFLLRSSLRKKGPVLCFCPASDCQVSVSPVRHLW
jgi:hypothetical protein